jgi:antibiotic biosynthesis monooxygenase (ABM) superfamily enzyme
MTNPSVQITTLRINIGEVGEHVDWLARLMMVVVEQWNAVSAEIIPPSSTKNDWSLVQRFKSEEDLIRWSQSSQRAKFMGEILPLVENGAIEVSESTTESYGTTGSVAVAIVTEVKPGQESAYGEIEGAFQRAQARRRGYRGVYVQPPTSGTKGLWTTLLRFDSPEALDEWFHSEERLQLVAQLEPIVASTEYQRVATSFPGWFPAEDGRKTGPPNWKTAMLILLGLYPIVMVEIRYFLPYVNALNSAVANFIGNILSVAATTYITMPASIKLFNKWLFPVTKQANSWGPGVVAILLAAYALEIYIFAVVAP